MKEILLDYCKRTSVKGIPRVIAAKTLFMRFVWLISIVLFLCAASFQTYSLTLMFVSYPYFTMQREVRYDLKDPESRITLPEITLCNLQPFFLNGGYSSSQGIPTVQDYINLVQNLTSCVDCVEGKPNFHLLLYCY